MIFFLFLTETIYCDPSSESSHRDGLNEGSQHMFYAELTKLSLIISKYSLLSRVLTVNCRPMNISSITNEVQ